MRIFVKGNVCHANIFRDAATATCEQVLDGEALLAFRRTAVQSSTEGHLGLTNLHWPLLECVCLVDTVAVIHHRTVLCLPDA